MDSTKLETFLFVCKEKSFTKAAEKLFITPAAVKKQIDALEAEVGVKLVFRSAGGCSLTAPGEVFYEQAKKILRLIHTSVEVTQQAGMVRKQELRVGHSVKFHYGFLSDLIGGYAESYPDSSVRMERIKKTELATALQKDLIDCFLYINPQHSDFPGIASEQVGQTRVHAVVRRQHPLAGKELVTAAELEGYDVYFSAVLDQDLYEDLGIRLGSNLRILDTVDRDELMSGLQRNAISLYPCPGAYNISIPFEYPPMEIRLLYKRNAHAHENFAAYLRQYFQRKPDQILL